jgi:hypothetical protein
MKSGFMAFCLLSSAFTTLATTFHRRLFGGIVVWIGFRHFGSDFAQIVRELFGECGGDFGLGCGEVLALADVGLGGQRAWFSPVS